MTEQQHTSYSEQYRRAREAFDEMSIESQARFLIEATASTIGRGIDLVARSMAEEVDQAFGEKKERTDDPKNKDTGTPPPANGEQDDSEPPDS